METFFHEMRAAVDSRFFGTGNDDESITVWDSATLKMVGVAKPGFKGGRERFVIDPGASKIFSGTWETGLSCYDYAVHKRLWHRKDLIGIQRVDISQAFPNSLFVAVETPDHRVDEPGMFTGILELDRTSGTELWRGSYFGDMYLHSDKPVIVIEDGAEKMLRILDKGKRPLGSTKLANFAVLDVAFHGDKIALAEGAKGVRVLDLHGAVAFQYRPADRKPNCIEITFDSNSGNLAVSDSWDGAFVTILDPISGKVIHEYKQSQGGLACFVQGGSCYINHRGQMFRTSDGILQNSIGK